MSNPYGARDTERIRAALFFGSRGFDVLGVDNDWC